MNELIALAPLAAVYTHTRLSVHAQGIAVFNSIDIFGKGMCVSIHKIDNLTGSLTVIRNYPYDYTYSTIDTNLTDSTSTRVGQLCLLIYRIFKYDAARRLTIYPPLHSPASLTITQVVEMITGIVCAAAYLRNIGVTSPSRTSNAQWSVRAEFIHPPRCIDTKLYITMREHGIHTSMGTVERYYTYKHIRYTVPFHANTIINPYYWEIDGDDASMTRCIYESAVCTIRTILDFINSRRCATVT